MREIFSDMGGNDQLSDPDPVRRAQIQMRTPLPKRFYAEASVVAGADGHEVRLDGKPVRTPGKKLLALPTATAATLVADEFAAQVDVINPVTMPVLRLANTVIDGVSTELPAVAQEIVRYSGSDLLCYRADAPEQLAARQSAHWDPVLAWAKSALGARFRLAEGVIHVEQPQDVLAAVEMWLAGRQEPFRVAALHVMTTLSGSALLALAVEAGELSPDAAWTAAHVDEDWNIEQWGTDEEATARRHARRQDFDAAVRLLSALAA